jgi:dTDP-4-dehydrorhamnose reductase
MRSWAYHQVDRCETEIAPAFRTNSFGPRELARLCEPRRTVLVHFSTNYVFDGRQREPYDEEAAPNPLSVYGLSKLAGERAVHAHGLQHLVIRSCGLYGLHQGQRFAENFVERMIAAGSDGKGGRPLRVVNDQMVTPTYTGHLAQAVIKLLAARARGLYHVTNSGACSWWEFARAILLRAGLPAEVQPITSASYDAAAPRPAYSVMISRNAAQAGLAPLPAWEEGLDAYFQERARRSGEIGVRVEF